MPSPTLAAAAEAAPPLRRRQRRPFQSVTLPLPVFRSLELPPSRDWAGLPPDLLSSILHRLDHVQIMLGADKVCRSWRRAARDEPELWRRIDMRGYGALSYRNLIDLNQMALEAARRSQGQCEAFSVEGGGRQCEAFSVEGSGLRDDLIHFLADQAPLLKRLILVSCTQLSCEGFVQAMTGFPLLEELHLSKCWVVQRARVLEVIARECPRLKYLTICDADFGPTLAYIANEEAMAIAKMKELRSLQLTHNDLTNEGLEAIIDECLHLKSLDILKCYNVLMTPEMEARIMSKKLLMNYSSDWIWGDDGFGEQVCPTSQCSFDEQVCPTSQCSTCVSYFGPNEERYYFVPSEERHRDKKEAMVISAVRELRSLELYRNRLTSKGLAAVLDKCPLLEPLDVWNCLYIVRNNHNARRAQWHQIKTKKIALGCEDRRPIKTKKVTTKLLMDRSKLNVFNPEGLDIHNCRNIVMNSHGGRRIMDSTLGAKDRRLELRKMAKKYHARTKTMKATIEAYMAKLPGGNKKYHARNTTMKASIEAYKAKLPGGNLDYMEFEGAEFDASGYHFNFRAFEPDYYTYNYYWELDHLKKPGHGYREFGGVESEAGGRINECSTCLMFEYLAERWGVLDLDDYADYYDSSYGLGIHDETEFQVHDRMLGKRFRRYLETGLMGIMPFWTS